MRAARLIREGSSAVALVALALTACTGSIEPAGSAGPEGPGVVPPPGSGPGQPARPPGAAPEINAGPAPSSRFVRLTHQQWENTVRDLFALPAPPNLSGSFVAEPLRSTFDTNGSLLTVPPDLWSDYQSAAETLAARVAHDPGLVPAGTTGRAFVQAVGLRAYRRPLTDAEVAGYTGLFDRGAALIGSTDPFADGVELVLAALLQSPHFLYRMELGTRVSAGKIRLDDYEVASRLSYALTNSMPDPGLFAAAAAGKLQNRAGVVAEAARLLETPAARATVADFHGQLMKMSAYDQVKKDGPAFAGIAGADLKEEALAFLRDAVFDRSAGLGELLTASHTFANSRIARLYGLTATTPRAGQPDPFVRVELDRTQRAGLLTQVGFLAANGEGETPSSIMRGVQVARAFLCVDLPPPPDAVPPLPAIMPGSTNRQRVEALTNASPCSACHTTLINPLGFALENLDGMGRFRAEENGRTIDPSGSYELDGRNVPFRGAVDLMQALAGSKQAHDCYAHRWVEYLYGRDVDQTRPADDQLVRQAGLVSKAGTIKGLIVDLLATDAFLTRLP